MKPGAAPADRSQHLKKVSVRDNGPGFTAEQRSKTFNAIYVTRNNGNGLGLAICRRVIESQGGRIDPGPEQGPGAEFIISWPRGHQ